MCLYETLQPLLPADEMVLPELTVVTAEHITLTCYNCNTRSEFNNVKYVFGGHQINPDGTVLDKMEISTELYCPGCDMQFKLVVANCDRKYSWMEV